MRDAGAPQWLWEVFLSLGRMLKPNHNNRPSETYMNYDHFMTTPASLSLLLYLADLGRYTREAPPSVLEFNMGGSIALGDRELCLEGGEIKSSYKGM